MLACFLFPPRVNRLRLVRRWWAQKLSVLENLKRNEERGEKVGPAYFSAVMKFAQGGQEIKSLLQEAETRFGVPLPWQLLSSAAFSARSSDPGLSVALLKKIPPKDLARVHLPVFGKILHCASLQRSPDLAQIVFDMIPPEHRDLHHISRLIESGIDPQEGKIILRQALKTPPSDGRLEMGTLGSFLKLSSNCNDPDLATALWAWSEVPRQQANKDELRIVTVQYLMICGKAGRLQLAQDAFNEAKLLGIAQQTQIIGAMLTVYSFFGAVLETEALLSTVPLQKIDERMLISVLATFSHAQRLDDAWNLVQRLKSTGTVIGVNAYTAIVDAYARMGDFTSAMKILSYARENGVEPSFITWYAVLSPCRRFKELSVGLEAFKEIQKLPIPEEEKIASYVLLADVHRACGDEDSARALHDQRLKLGLHKTPCAVDVTVDGVTSTFNVGRVPPQLVDWTEQIYSKLDQWGQEVVSRGASLESIACRHAEKLALAYAVLRGEKDITLRKNLRICDACHQASLIITVYESITIRHWDNSRRVHIMENGRCSCGGRY